MVPRLEFRGAPHPVRVMLRLLLLGMFCVAGGPSVTARGESIECVKTAAFFAAPDSPDYRKYAPDRDVLLTHLALDITPDFKQRTVQGRATLQLKANARPVREVRLDAVDLRVRSVEATPPVEAYQVTDEALIVTFARDLPAGEQARVTVAYEAEPQRGLYFRTPELGYKPGDTHLFTQGEEIEARHWYPALDFPNQFFASEIICRVPEGMTVISNGRLIGQTREPSGLTAFHWRQDKPHVNYLVTLVAGYFKTLEDRYRDIPLAFHTPPSDFPQAAHSFRGTREMLAFFQQEIGVPYPWAKYDQVVVHDFVAGGMENTSATTLTDRTLFTEATENIRNSEGLVSHELAHQWFGNLVTCKDLSHIWLNEGFATYYESLWTAFRHGRNDMLYELYHRARQIASRNNGNHPHRSPHFFRPGRNVQPPGLWQGRLGAAHVAGAARRGPFSPRHSRLP
jgi:aminopeptidase N